MITRTQKDVKSTTEIKRRLLLDIGQLASFIEEVFASYLRPHPPGVYLRDHSYPILTPGKNYWFEKVIMHDVTQFAHIAENLRPPIFHYEYIPVQHLEQVLFQPWDVVDAPEGEIVVSHRELKYAALQPSGPAHGLQIAKALVLNEVESRLDYRKHMRRTLEEIICEHMEESHSNYQAMRANTHGQDLVDAVFEEARIVLREVREFMGSNGWLMHELVSESDSRLYLDQQSDYRIYDWERRMLSGQWK